jgi:hypothetical protein
MLIPIFKEHNSKIKELLGIEYAPGTLERYETSLKHTTNFLFWKYNIIDINIDKIDHAFITDYEFYLRTVRKCANNTAVKYKQNIPAGANGTSNSPTLRTYQELRTQISDQQSIRNINSVGIYNSSYDGTKIDNTKGKYNVTQLGAGNIQYQNSYGEVVRIKGYSNWGQIARENRVGDFGEAKYLTYSIDPDLLIPIIESKTVRAADQINLTPLFEVSNSSKSIGDRVTIQGTQFLIRDLVKFRFEVIAPGQTPRFLYFRALLENLDDSYTGRWSDTNYVGRGDAVRTYEGFNRDVSLSFKIVATTRDEMKPLYKKMAYLASTTAPTYGEGGSFMKGTLVRLTVGSYLYEVAGTMNSVKYNWKENYPWEIAMQNPDLNIDDDQQELPQMMDCSINFTPIHDFVPQTGLYHYITSPRLSGGAKPFFLSGAQS